MNRLGVGLIALGAAVVVVAFFGGTWLQSVADYDTAAVVSAIVGALGGSCAVQGIAILSLHRVYTKRGPDGEAVAVQLIPD